MVTLILTEKPSVAMDFARALGIDGGKRRNGYLEGNGYIVTWAVGHLVELAAPEDYDRKWKSWSLATLPILPQAMRYKPIPDVEKQLRIVQQQLRRSEVEQVVVATDAGREGEVIARTVLQTVESFQGKVYRFWTSQALTPEVVRETLKHLRPGTDFDRLWNAGQARQIADWLVGMNLTRAATLKLRGDTKELFSIGRVQTAVLALLVDRRRERDNFKPEPYWLLRARFLCEGKGQWWGTWFKGDVNRFTAKEEAERTLDGTLGKTGKVRSVKREKKKQPPPFLYSLTDLQRDANAKYGLSAKQTLDIAQGLYEDKKCLSYPRTDSKVLGSQNVDMVKEIVSKLTAAYPGIFKGVIPGRISTSNKRVFNDARLTDHHALIPLAPLPSSASHNESLVYNLVMKRFAAAFYPDYEYESTEIITLVAAETFRTTGSCPLVPGWKAVYGFGAKEAAGKNAAEAADSAGDETPEGGRDEPEQENLPPLEKNDPAKVEEARLDEKMTQPPDEYTEALLLKDMTNPSRYVSEQELQKIFKGDVGLGTQATRAQIIETLLNRQYVRREKKKLLATDKGCFLIDHLRRFERARAIATPEETARWEMELENIAQGVGDRQAFMAGIIRFVEDGVEELKMSGGEQRQGGQATGRPAGRAPSFGKCPVCGGEIIEGKRGFGCSNWREEHGGCRFVIWKETAGRRIDPKALRILLAGGATPAAELRSEDGTAAFASLRLLKSEETGQWEVRIVAPEPGAEEPGDGSGDGSAPGGASGAIGNCPRCGGEIVESRKGYGCRNWREEDGGCRFVIWKTVAGKELPMEAVQELLSRGETSPISGFISKKGNPFSARLKLEGEEHKVVFVF